MIATIETARLILRPVTLNDAQDFFELDSNPEVHKYLGKNPVSNIAQSKEMIENILYQYKKYKLGRLAVIEKATGKFVGWSGLKYETNFLVDTNYYDLGYRLKEEFWGKGYATETTIKLLDYGFNTLQLNKICAAAHIDNIGSNKILSKLLMLQKEPVFWQDMQCNWYELTRKYYGK